MSKALTYYSIIIASFFMAFIFTTATTYTQLAGAILLFPVFSFFILKILPRKHKSIHSNVSVQPQPSPNFQSSTTEVMQPQINYTETVEDVDKRAFLKIIGATSLSLFVTSIFSKRAESLFFGGSSATNLSLLDTQGKKVNPVERQPTDGYQITEIDDSLTAYFGFVNREGNWFIMREDSEEGSFRYAKGNSNFSPNWKDRDKLDYYYFHEVFK